MTAKKKKKMTKTRTNRGPKVELVPVYGDEQDLRCAFAVGKSKGCTIDVTGDDWCYGCRFYICYHHEQNPECWGWGHEPWNHLKEFA